MKNNNLDAFKAKANSVLLSEAMLNVTGGVTAADVEYCHVEGSNTHGNGKLKEGYSQIQIDKFFSNVDWTIKFDSMYDPRNPDSPMIRDDFFRSMVGSIQ